MRKREILQEILILTLTFTLTIKHKVYVPNDVFYIIYKLYARRNVP